MSKQSDAKIEQGYRETPHTCGNCANFQSDKEPHEERDSKIYYTEKKLRCGIDGFAVKKTGWCKFWKPEETPCSEPKKD